MKLFLTISLVLFLVGCGSNTIIEFTPYNQTDTLCTYTYIDKEQSQDAELVCIDK